MIILEDVFKEGLSGPEKPKNALALNFSCNTYSTGDMQRGEIPSLFIITAL